MQLLLLQPGGSAAKGGEICVLFGTCL